MGEASILIGMVGAVGGLGGLISLIGVFVAYGRLQGRVSELTRDIAEMKANDKLLHERISGKTEEYQALMERLIKLEEGQKYIREDFARHFPPHRDRE